MLPIYTDRIIQKNPKGERVSVDIFRGLTITAMILINNRGISGTCKARRLTETLPLIRIEKVKH